MTDTSQSRISRAAAREAIPAAVETVPDQTVGAVLEQQPCHRRFLRDAAMLAAPTYDELVSSSAVEPVSLPPADEATVRRRGDELRTLAARYGVSDLRFASPGRLVGTVAEDRDALDTADFEIAARALLGAEVALFSDRVLSKPHVSPDLVAAQPL